MLQVIGAGLGRTGTHSLAYALDKLGFDPCYTIMDIDKNIAHTKLWLEALEGNAVAWDNLFQNYRSAVEWPTVSFLSPILAQFPQAKVILTRRDPESWYESAAATIFPSLEATARHPDPEIRQRTALKRHLILDKLFAGRYWEKAYAIQVYQDHIQAVENLVPTERLLHFNVKEGWLPLCLFLGVETPHEPFPRQNERAIFMKSTPEWAKKVMAENKIKRDKYSRS